MKKLALTTVCALAMAGAAFAQGTLNWSSVNPAGMTAQTNAVTVSPLFGGGASGILNATVGATSVAAAGFYYELLYNTAFVSGTIAKPSTVSALTGSWVDSGLVANNATSSAGRLIVLNSSTGAGVATWVGGIGTLGGTTNNVMLVGWSVNLGTSWSTVKNMLTNWETVRDGVTGQAFFGMSNTGYLVPNTAAPGATVFATGATVNGLPILSLNTQLYVLPVPEPSTFALAGLGALSLLLFRRRQ
jgi:hypothetical protein